MAFFKFTIDTFSSNHITYFLVTTAYCFVFITYKHKKKDAEIDVGLVEKDGAIGLKHDKISNMKAFSVKKNLYKQTCRILNHD